MNVGETVTIKVKNPRYWARNLYANRWNGPEFEEYTGTIVHENWYGNDRIGITSNVRGYPVRVISRKNIVEISGAQVNFDINDSKTIVVQGSKGNTYIVTKENGKVSCSCPGFGFRKSCRHIKEIA